MLERQHRETRALRRHIYGILPLRRASRIFEPGCGSGLVLREVSALTGAGLTGMDSDESMLAEARARVPGARLIRADFLRAVLPRADLVLLSHVILHVPEPKRFAARLAAALTPGGLVAVLGEYDWLAASEEPAEGLLDLLRASLSSEGLRLESAGCLDDAFRAGGLRKMAGGRTRAIPSKPAEDFLSLQIATMAEGPGPGLHWSCRLAIPLVWGVYLRP